ncbi:hypothetical protein [Nocardia nova]
MSGTPTDEWLVTVTGPVSSTYAAVRLTRREAEAMQRVALAVAEAAKVSDLHPRIDITPMSSTTGRQRRLLTAALNEQLAVLVGSH